MAKINLVGVVVALGTLLCASTAHAVGHGYADSNTDFPFAGDLVWQGRGCTGVLVSPTWVLTARHCTNGEVYYGTSPPTILQPPANGQPTVDFKGTPDFNATQCGTTTFCDPRVNQGKLTIPITSAPVATNEAFGELSADLDYDVGIDVALIRLQSRIPQLYVQPLHPPIFGPGCNFQNGLGDDNFTGFLIGYGGTSGLSSPSGGGYRNYAGSTGWSFKDETVGAAYSEFWFLPNSGYAGSLQGDSGGPLVVPDGVALDHGVYPWLLCGTVSRHTTDFGKVTPRERSDMAAFDTPEVTSFVASHIVDHYQRFMGECAIQGKTASYASQCGSGICFDDADTDGDLIPDQCDPCVNVAAERVKARETVVV